MVEYYSKQADEVIVIISDPKSAKSKRKTALGTTITPQAAKQIWELYLKRYGISNAEVIVSKDPSPVTAMFKYVDEKLKDVNVIFGVSKKDNDLSRFKSAEKYYEDNEHINLLDPIETAVEPYALADGTAASATDIRNSIDDPEKAKALLPSKLSDAEKEKVLKIIMSGPKAESVEEQEDAEEESSSLDPVDEEECIHLSIDDDLLKDAKIIAYNNN